MKKLTMLALAVVFSASAFAQDVYKQLSKIKDYKEAYNLLQTNLGSLSAEEKAKCYNVLVDLAYDKVVKEQGTITENQMAAQLGTKVAPYDTVGLYDAVLQAIENGVTCDEFDMQPNEKGKVKPKFHKSNAERLYPIRYHLINAGIYYQTTNEALSYKYLATYVESADYPLFKEQDKSKDTNLTQIAYYAARSAYFAKDYAKAEKYADIALADTAVAQEALQVKLAVMQSQLKTHEDTLTYISKLKELYSKDESNEMIFSTICSMYISINDKTGLNEIVKAKLATDPNNFTALAMTGQAYMNDHKWDDAIAALSKAESVQPENVAVVASIGNSYMYKAQEAVELATQGGKRLSPETEAQIIDIYKQAISYLEKAKNLDTTMQFKSVWAYSLYTCCYRALGPDDAKTKEAEALTK
jgi:hypothetical protein